MKKIFIASSVHKWSDSRIFNKEAVSLAKKYEVELHAPGDFKYRKIDNVNVFCLKGYKKRYLRPLNWLKIFWRAVNSNCAVFHFHDPDLLSVGLLVKIFTNKRVVYDVHECYSEIILIRSWIPAYMKLYISRTFSVFEKIASNIFDYVVTATDNIAENLGCKSCAIIKNYPSYNEKISTQFHQKQKDGNILVYIGSINEVRGACEIVEALGFIDNKFRVKLKLIGSFDKEDFKDKIKGMKEFGSVEIVDWLSQDELYDELLKARIGLSCLHPKKNYINSLARKTFEYMSCGLPVIASNFPLWKKIVEGNNCGLTVNPLKPEEIARAVERLLSNAELMETMGENGIRSVREKYNWDSQENKLLKLYDSLVG